MKKIEGKKKKSPCFSALLRKILENYEERLDMLRMDWMSHSLSPLMPFITHECIFNTSRNLYTKILNSNPHLNYDKAKITQATASRKLLFDLLVTCQH